MNQVKGKPMRKELGMDVSIDVTALKKDHEANEVLHKIGQNLAKLQPGMEYIGTISIAMFKETNAIAKASYSLSNVTNICMKQDLSEQAVLTLWQNAAIQIRQYFNPSFTHKSTDAKDLRGSIK